MPKYPNNRRALVVSACLLMLAVLLATLMRQNNERREKFPDIGDMYVGFQEPPEESSDSTDTPQSLLSD